MKEDKTGLEGKEEQPEVVKPTEVPNTISTEGLKLVKSASKPIEFGSNLVEYTEPLLAQAQAYVDTGLLPDDVDTAQKALLIMQKGHEFGFTAMTAFEHIVIVNNKPSLDGAALGNLLMRGGVEWEIVDNGKPIYDTNFKGEKIIYVKGIKKEGNKSTPILVPATKEQIEANLSALTYKVVDKVTTINFMRISKVTGEPRYHTSSFSLTEAASAELTGKLVWKRYPKLMLFWRALSIGAKQFAPDLTLGMSTAEEIGDGNILMDSNGKVVWMDEDN